jgi:lysophospholipase L1-like esterase
MKIIFFGDSLTQGTVGVGYVDKVALALRGHHFINQGVNGDTSLNLYRRIDQDVIAERPDGVFVMIGINDAVSSLASGSKLYFRFVKGVRAGQLSPIAFRENMRALLSKLITAQLKTWVALPPIEYNPAQVNVLREMNGYTAEICRELGIPALDLMAQMTPTTIPERPARSVGTLPDSLLALLGGEKYYDTQREAGGFSYSFDGIHLTDTGAQRMADLIAPFLRANGVK